MIQGSSCIDGSNGFAGNLSITNSTFISNRYPLAVICAGSSCNMTMTDTAFQDNIGAEASAARFDCGTTTSCSFSCTRCLFSNSSIDSDSAYNATAGALLVIAAQSSLTLSLSNCSFSNNDGAGLSNNMLSGLVTLSNCSFVAHRAVVGGLQALCISGASSVLLSDSVWQGNMQGAMAIAQAQTRVLLARCSVSDNQPSPLTLDTVDLLMADQSPSTVSILSCSFSNNSGYAINAGIVYYAAGAVNIQSSSSPPSVSSIAILIQDSSFVGNYGFLMPGSVSVFSALNAVIIRSTFSSNIGGAMYLSDVQDTLVSTSTFTSNYGMGRTDPAFVSAGSGGITWLSCENMQVLNNVFVNNSAVNSGGAIHAQGLSSTRSIFNATGNIFAQNKALSGSGGAIFASFAGFISITSSNFTDCTAAVAGGSVYIGDTYGTNSVNNGATIFYCNFTNSAAGFLPAGGWLSSDVFALGPQDVDAQLQVQGGGGIYISQGSGASVQYCIFSSCSAVRSRGGGLAYEGEPEVRSVFFVFPKLPSSCWWCVFCKQHAAACGGEVGGKSESIR